MKKVAMVSLLLAGLVPAVLFHSSAATPNIVGLASGDKEFSTLVTALKAADLVKTLEGAGPFTVFAPTNAAFEKVPKKELDELLANKKELTRVLLYHVVSGKVTAAEALKMNGKTAKSVEGAELNFKVMGTTLEVNNAKVSKTDLMASNGVIHVIDTVLMPPKAK